MEGRPIFAGFIALLLILGAYTFFEVILPNLFLILKSL